MTTVAPKRLEPQGPARLAIAHEWLDARTGSDKTFEAMAAAFADADLYALTWNRSAPFDFGGRRLNLTFLDRLGALGRRRGLMLPLMPMAWRVTGRRAYDKVLTSSHACVKGFRPGRRAEHFCYCHTPMRYAWEPALDQRLPPPLQPPVRAAAAVLRAWDRRSSDWVDHFAANSTAVRERIRRAYGRDAKVIAPPVDTDFYTRGDGSEANETEPYAIAVSRFIPYKRMDLAITACARAGLPLVVAGHGPEERRLRQLAADLRADVRFEIGPSDARLRQLYRAAAMLVFPAHEDFGIVPVEAQACGTPVIGLDAGGLRDSVRDGETGLLMPSPDPGLFAEAARALLERPPAPAACRANAERFSRARFIDELRAWVGS